MKFPLLSHFSLLLGCALPIWMSSGYNDRPLAPFAGILSLGIGDTMVSFIIPCFCGQYCHNLIIIIIIVIIWFVIFINVGILGYQLISWDINSVLVSLSDKNCYLWTVLCSALLNLGKVVGRQKIMLMKTKLFAFSTIFSEDAKMGSFSFIYFSLFVDVVFLYGSQLMDLCKVF